MYRPHRRAWTFVLLPLLAACPPAQEGDEAEVLPAEPTQAEIDDAVARGSAAAGLLAGTLIQHLSAAMNEGGPAAAIEFCSDEAMSLTAEVNATWDGMEAKRTSTRLRNPANRPDSLEAIALAYFESELVSTGSLPTNWVQPAGDGSFRYYQPLVINDMCVQCHGAVESLDPAVAARLSELYPEDEAIGYVPGDFRGLIRVSIPRDEGSGP